MAIPISNVPRRVVFDASGTGPYAFTFEILAESDIAVYRDDDLLTITTDYTVTINTNGTGSVTLTAAPTGATQIAIVGNRTIARSTDFTTGGDFFANTLNDELDQQTIFAQQNAEAVERALKAPQTDPTTIDMTLPRAVDRAGKYLAFDANGNPDLGVSVVDVTTVTAIANEIVVVSGISTDIVDVAGNETNINLVAGSITNVNNVGGSIANVNSVAGNATNINTVATDLNGIDSIGTVAGSIANVNAVGGSITTVATVGNNIASIINVDNNSANINAVAADATDIGVVATNIGAVQTLSSDLGGSGFDYDLGSITDPATGPSGTPDGFIVTVFNNLTDIQTVAGIDGEVSAVAAISTEVVAVDANATNINAVATDLLGSDTIGTVAGIAGNVTTVANISADVTAVAGDATDIGTVATDLSGTNTIGTVAANIANVNAVAAIDSDVTAVAGDATDIGLVAGQISPTNNIATVAGQATNIAALGPISADITTVAGDSADIQSLATKTVQIGVIGDDLAGTGFNYDLGSVADAAVGPGASPDGYLVTVYNNIADIQAVAAIDDDITIVADNVADITNFADVYQGPKTSDPALRNDGSALQAGDLYFNTVDALMKVYSGTVWIGAYAGLGDLAGDLAYLDTVDTAQIEDGAITSSKLDSTLDLGAIA